MDNLKKSRRSAARYALGKIVPRVAKKYCGDIGRAVILVISSPTSNSVFNSAVVPFKGGYAGVFRCDDTNRRMRLHGGFSADAIH